MTSIRKLASNNNIISNISIKKDIFGYKYGGSKSSLSLQTYFNLLKHKYIDLNLIMVVSKRDHQYESLTWPGIERALEVTRAILGQIGLGINRAYHLVVSDPEFVVVDNRKAQKLTRRYTGVQGAIDCFFVSSYYGNSTVGLGPVPGPRIWFSGVVVSREEDKHNWWPDEIGETLAHELGHYLGLEHICELETQPPKSKCGILSISVPCGLWEKQYSMHPIIGSGRNLGVFDNPYQPLDQLVKLNQIGGLEKNIVLQHDYVREGFSF